MAKRNRKNQREVNEKFSYSPPTVHPKTENQRLMLRSMIENQITIASGSAGTGKTFLAAYRAACDYLEGRVDKIIIARPNRQMGQSTGYLPGTEEEKMLPFLRPILDNLRKFIGDGKFDNDYGKNIEVAPVEKIRGRSFDDPVAIIIDEVQNTTKDQMKAIISRLGEDAYMVLCGDPMQTDVGTNNGLTWLVKLLEYSPIDGMETVNFTSSDIVRGRLVKDFIQTLEKLPKELQ